MRAKNYFDKKETLDEIICDLKLIIGRDEITGKEIEEILKDAGSEEVKKYLESLKAGSKPEDALKDAFFAGVNSPLVKYLFGWINPETNVESGFVDYLTDSRSDSKGIAIEIKPLFEAKFERGKSGRVLDKIVERKLRWDKYKDQIRKYLGRRGEFVIFTNLKEWYFFSRSYSSDEKCDYFFNTDFVAFVEEYSQIEDLPEYLDRKEQEAIKEVLDKKFFASLRSWINELSEAEFVPGISEREKNELIINLINKFIFIQTLDDFWVIENKWIQNHWDSVERKWQAKGKLKVLAEFFNEEVNKWFYEFYDTELFRDNIPDYVEKDERNIDLFYRKLKLVLGIDFGATAIGWVRGIMQYNFRRINEDIFGKAYENYLSDFRKEQGIFYTPSYITEYIVENTVGRIFDDILGEIERELSAEKFEEAKKLVEKFIAVKVLDTACGSGSFLIKALRLIWRKYARLREILGDRERVYFENGFSSDELGELKEIKRILGAGNNKDRELISKVIVRHIHGNDLDGRALEVAKVNIWLEAIKLAPKDFRFDLLGETNHILPDLEMNLTCGDSLVGLPEDLTIEVLKEHKEEIVKLWELRMKYLEDTSRAELVDSIEKIKNELRGMLYKAFKKYLEENNLPLEILDETKPLHWALEFWYVFFGENGEALPEEERGYDAVIGNPPHGAKYGAESKNFLKMRYKLVKRATESAKSFLEKGNYVLRQGCLLSFVIPKASTYSYSWEDFRNFVFNDVSIKSAIDLSKAFEDVKHEQIILTVQKSEPAEMVKYVVGYADENSVKEIGVVNTEDSKKFGIVLTNVVNDEVSLGLKVKDHDDLAEENLDIFRGFPRKFRSNDGVTCVKGIEVDRYFLHKPNECIDVSEKDQRSQRMKNQKVISQRIVAHITKPIDQLLIKSTVDDKGKLLTFETVANIVPKNESVTPIYISALLNSKLLGWYIYRFIYNKAIRDMDFDSYFILKIPISLNPDIQEKIDVVVSKILFLKKSYHEILKIWNEWSIKLKNDELSLHQILVNDANLMRKGEFEKTWTSEATFYPDGEHENLSKGFKNFRLVGDNEKPTLKVYGLDENNKEELIYEMKFQNRELMLHVFLSIKQALESTRKIKTLAHLLAKTVVPIIQPDSEINTPNMVRKVREEFGKWVESERIEKVEPDIVKIENEIEDVDARIDALVFRLYGLSKEEILTVLDSLGTLESMSKSILKKFDNLGGG